MLESVSAPIWYSTLRADAMYYHAAKMSYKAAAVAKNGIKRANKDFALLCDKEEVILNKYDRDYSKAYDELEPLYIQMDGSEYDIGAAYGPYLQNIAITHILCATTVEAHINVLAKEKLSGRAHDNFERISLEGKWLFLPSLLGKPSFEQGAEPFQSFSSMIKYRNELVHYKGRKEEWKLISGGEPKLLDKLGLSLTKAKKSLEAVRNIIISLSDRLELEQPYWLKRRFEKLPTDIKMNFFDVVAEREQ
jgi:hypothetical protein